MGERGVGGGERRRVPLIFKAVREGRPYPDHGMTTRDWALIPPRQVRMDTLVTTKRELALDALMPVAQPAVGPTTESLPAQPPVPAPQQRDDR